MCDTMPFFDTLDVPVSPLASKDSMNQPITDQIFNSFYKSLKVQSLKLKGDTEIQPLYLKLSSFSR